MGTRNLTMVIDKEGETKIAQYGQWDGYPEGSGYEILEFLSAKSRRDALEDSLKKIRFQTEDDEKETQEFLDSIGASDGWMNIEQSKKWQEEYPLLSRDVGSSILQAVIESEDDQIVLVDSSDFHKDSLFCEWRYDVNFKENTFIVYNGSVKVAEYSLDNLPTNQKLLDDCREEEEIDE